MIKNLPTHQLNNLLEYFNYLWNNNLFPEQWSTAIVLPFLKPKKPPRLTASYRPISLTSCLCKLFEKMVLVRLSKYMETKKHIKSYQSGFKRLHSTYDPLVALEGAIQETFIRDDFLVAIFIDLEKAYDMVWQQLVLKILQKLELKGNLPNFILNFLKNRKIKVRIGDTLSEPIDVDNGLPQGSVLSCILFLLIINSIFEELEEDVYKALFCDDGLFWATGKNLNDVIKTIQKALNCISEWCDYHGPKISITKTHFNIFTRKTKFVTPELFLNGTQLKRYKSVKYLGVIFDQGLTWKLHINDLVKRCQQPLNMMRKASRHDWGGDRTSLKLLYTGLIRSKIDYACFLYSNAAKTHLDKLDVIQNEANRIILGIFRCTMIDNLDAETNLLPLTFRRKQLALNYFGKAYRIYEHPTKILYDDFHSHPHYATRPYALPVVGRVKALVNNGKIPFDKLEKLQLNNLYTTNNTKIFYSLVKTKSNYTDIQFKTDFNCLINSKYTNYIRLFTDGSKIKQKCGCAFFADIDNPVTVKKRLPSTTSVFNAELYAIYIAIKYCIQLPINNNFVIFTDSLSALQFLDNPSMDHKIKLKILELLNSSNKNILMEWVPGHSSIRGNDLADSAAKESLNNDMIVKLPIMFGDFKSLIKSFVFSQWQQAWTLFGRCRLKDFKPILGDWKSAYRDDRKEEKKLSRLRTGSCLFLHQHFFDRDKPIEKCISCNIELTIKHILIECPALNTSRLRLVNYINQKRLDLDEETLLGDTFPHGLLFKFLKETPYYKKI